jgi:hypothetical protein
MKCDKFKDCPVCGAENSVKERIKFKDIITPDGYTAIHAC